MDSQKPNSFLPIAYQFGIDQRKPQFFQYYNKAIYKQYVCPHRKVSQQLLMYKGYCHTLCSKQQFNKWHQPYHTNALVFTACICYCSRKKIKKFDAVINVWYIIKKRIIVAIILFLFGDPHGARTHDPNIKSVVLYQLSQRVIILLILLARCLMFRTASLPDKRMQR